MDRIHEKHIFSGNKVEMRDAIHRARRNVLIRETFKKPAISRRARYPIPLRVGSVAG